MTLSRAALTVCEAWRSPRFIAMDVGQRIRPAPSLWMGARVMVHAIRDAGGCPGGIWLDPRADAPLTTYLQGLVAALWLRCSMSTELISPPGAWWLLGFERLRAPEPPATGSRRRVRSGAFVLRAEDGVASETDFETSLTREARTSRPTDRIARIDGLRRRSFLLDELAPWLTHEVVVHARASKGLVATDEVASQPLAPARFGL